MTDDKPNLLVRLLPDRTLRMKLPKKGARWQQAGKTIDEAVQKAMKEGLIPPFTIEYVDEETP